MCETTNQYIIDYHGACQNTNMEPDLDPQWIPSSHFPKNIRRYIPKKTPQNMYNTYPHKKFLQHTVC